MTHFVLPTRRDCTARSGSCSLPGRRSVSAWSMGFAALILLNAASAVPLPQPLDKLKIQRLADPVGDIAGEVPSVEEAKRVDEQGDSAETEQPSAAAVDSTQQPLGTKAATSHAGLPAPISVSAVQALAGIHTAAGSAAPQPTDMSGVDEVKVHSPSAEGSAGPVDVKQAASDPRPGLQPLPQAQMDMIENVFAPAGQR